MLEVVFAMTIGIALAALGVMVVATEIREGGDGAIAVGLSGVFLVAFGVCVMAMPFVLTP